MRPHVHELLQGGLYGAPVPQPQQTVVDEAWREPDPTVELLLDVARIVAYEQEALVTRTRMTAPQNRLASYLCGATYGVPITNLAVSLGTSVPNTSRMVERMRARGLVTVAASPLDARTRLVGLTAQGAADYLMGAQARADIERDVAARLRHVGLHQFTTGLREIRRIVWSRGDEIARARAEPSP